MRRSRWFDHGWGAMVVVVAAHVLFLICVAPAPISADAGFYHLAAQRIVDGFGYTGAEPHTSFMPGYPVFLAAFYLVFGKHPWIIRVVQAILVAASAGLLALTVERLADRRTARTAFWLLALFPAWFIYPGTLNAETLVMFLEVAFLWTIARPLQRMSDSALWGWGAASGAATALLALVKPEFSLWLPTAVVVAIGQRTGAKRIIQIGLASVVVFALLLAPWSVRNFHAFHRFIPLSTKVGATLWISGHRPEITEFQDPLFLGEFAKCEVEGDPKATDDCMGKDAKAMIADHPGYFLRTSAGRIVHTLVGSHTEYLRGYGISFTEAIRTHQLRIFVVKASLLALSTMFVATGLMGLVYIGIRRWFWFLPFMVGAKLLIHALLFGTPRYGLHLSPIFAMTTAILSVAIYKRLRPAIAESHAEQSIDRGRHGVASAQTR